MLLLQVPFIIGLVSVDPKSTKMANISPLIDSMLREYLLFRGFTTTLKSLENEIKSDKDKSFRVE